MLRGMWYAYISNKKFKAINEYKKWKYRDSSGYVKMEFYEMLDELNVRLENDHDLLIEYAKKAWWIIKPFYYFLSKKLNIKHSFLKNDKYNLLYL